MLWNHGMSQSRIVPLIKSRDRSRYGWIVGCYAPCRVSPPTLLIQHANHLNQKKKDAPRGSSKPSSVSRNLKIVTGAAFFGRAMRLRLLLGRQLSVTAVSYRIG
jgi:hypothetical protein